jgi:hypothetical protein
LGYPGVPPQFQSSVSPDGTQVTFSGRGLDRVPDWVRNLPDVTYLNLDENQLARLPDWLGDLTKLTGLFVRGNRLLTDVPASLGRLAKLTHLDLGGNALKDLPRELSQLTGLTSLTLDGNPLSEIPWAVFNLTNLASLNLSETELTDLPARLWRMKALTDLDLSHNQLRQVPDSIGRLTGLTRLKLDGNELTALPDPLRNLSRLDLLDVSYNRLRSLPRWLSGQAAGKPRVVLTDNNPLSQASKPPAYDGQRLDRAWIRLRSLFVPSVSLAAVRAASRTDDAAVAILQLYNWERDRLLTLAKGTAGAAVTVLTGLIATAVEEKTTLSAITLVPTAALVVVLLAWSGFILTGLRRLAEDYSTALTIKRRGR